MDFDIDADVSEREVTYDLDDRNIFKDIVTYSRSKQVLNEEQTIVTSLIYFTGLLPDWHDYAGGVITGGSAGGKSHMKQEVIDDFFAYVSEWLYKPTGSSDKAVIDDDEWDDARIGALNELQKIPQEMVEFLKSAHGDDGGFTYKRNVADGEKASGRSTATIHRDPKPVVFMLADENSFDVEQELRTRLIEIKVDENEEKNAAVHDMKWGHDHITLSSTDHEYVWDDPELWHAVRSHVRDLGTFVDDHDLEDVLIPTGDGRFEGDDWDAAHVTKPLFNFKRSQANRASSMIASLVKASALVNYHARPVVEYDGDNYLVVDPVDVGNIVAVRDVLLATTHGLTDKKFAVLKTIMDRGGQANPSKWGANAVQATKQDVIEGVQENPNVGSMSKSEINDILDELDEHLIINKADNPDDRRENIYIYDGGSTFKKPNIYDYYDHFSDVVDPILDQPIEKTIEDQLERLNARTEVSLDSDGTSTVASESDLSGFSGEKDASPSQLSDTAQIVHTRLSEVLHDRWVPARVMESNSLKIAHMIGESPLDEYEGETADGSTATFVEPEREPNGGDRTDGLLNPSHDVWDEGMDFSDVDNALDDAVGELRRNGLLSFEKDDVGNIKVVIS